MFRTVPVLVAVALTTACLGGISRSEPGFAFVDTASDSREDTALPDGEDLAEDLVTVSACGDLDLVIVNDARTRALKLSRSDAGQLAYAAQTTTTYSWDDDDDGLDAGLWVGTDLLPDPCTRGDVTAYYDVVQGSLDLKVSPSELAPDADGSFPIRVSVVVSQLGLSDSAGLDEDLMISALDVSWAGAVAPVDR